MLSFSCTALLTTLANHDESGRSWSSSQVAQLHSHLEFRRHTPSRCPRNCAVLTSGRVKYHWNGNVVSFPEDEVPSLSFRPASPCWCICCSHVFPLIPCVPCCCSSRFPKFLSRLPKTPFLYPCLVLHPCRCPSCVESSGLATEPE